MENIKNLVFKEKMVKFDDPKIDGRVLLKLYDNFYIDVVNIHHNINTLYFDRRNKFIEWLM